MSTKDHKQMAKSTPKKGGRVSKNPKAPVPGIAHKLFHQLVDCHRRCTAKDEELKTAQKKGWFGASDVKSATPPDPFSEFKALASTSKETLSSMFGSRAIPFSLPVTTAFASTVTTGILNANLPMDVTSSPEFASLAALFDEYRFVGGRIKYSIVAPTSTVVLGTSSLTVNAMFGIGFDGADNTAPTDIKDIAQLEYHQLHAPRMVSTPTVGTYVGVYGADSDNHPYRFDWKVEPLYTGNGGAVGPGMWKSTQGNVTNFPDGSLKTYYQTGATIAVNAMVGVMYWNVHFRCRK
jgi:hypothetical protein